MTYYRNKIVLSFMIFAVVLFLNACGNSINSDTVNNPIAGSTNSDNTSDTTNPKSTDTTNQEASDKQTIDIFIQNSIDAYNSIVAGQNDKIPEIMKSLDDSINSIDELRKKGNSPYISFIESLINRAEVKRLKTHYEIARYYYEEDDSDQATIWNYMIKEDLDEILKIKLPYENSFKYKSVKTPKIIGKAKKKKNLFKSFILDLQDYGYDIDYNSNDNAQYVSPNINRYWKKEFLFDLGLTYLADKKIKLLRLAFGKQNKDILPGDSLVFSGESNKTVYSSIYSSTYLDGIHFFDLYSTEYPKKLNKRYKSLTNLFWTNEVVTVRIDGKKYHEYSKSEMNCLQGLMEAFNGLLLIYS